MLVGARGALSHYFIDLAALATFDNCHSINHCEKQAAWLTVFVYAITSKFMQQADHLLSAVHPAVSPVPLIPP